MSYVNVWNEQSIELQIVAHLVSYLKQKSFLDICNETSQVARYLISLGVKEIQVEPIPKSFIVTSVLNQVVNNEHAYSIDIIARAALQAGFIKIDTNGNDLNVIKALHQVKPEIVMCEFATPGFYNGWEDGYPDAIIEEANKIGLKHCVILKNTDEYQLLSIDNFSFKDKQWGNLIFINDEIFLQAKKTLDQLIVDNEFSAIKNFTDQKKLLNSQIKKIPMIREEKSNFLLELDNTCKDRLELINRLDSELKTVVEHLHYQTTQMQLLQNEINELQKVCIDRQDLIAHLERECIDRTAMMVKQTQSHQYEILGLKQVCDERRNLINNLEQECKDRMEIVLTQAYSYQREISDLQTVCEERENLINKLEQECNNRMSIIVEQSKNYQGEITGLKNICDERAELIFMLEKECNDRMTIINQFSPNHGQKLLERLKQFMKKFILAIVS